MEAEIPTEHAQFMERSRPGLALATNFNSYQLQRKHRMRFIDREEVARRLTYELCIPIVRDAMIAFSRGETKQLLRSIIPLSEGRLIRRHARCDGRACSVRREVDQRLSTRTSLVEYSPTRVSSSYSIPKPARPVCVLHAGEITAIRTAAASAVATDALARKDARRLALLGYGEQAATHARAIGKVRNLESIVVWGRSPERARVFAERMQAELGCAGDRRQRRREAVAEADIVCTVTSARRADPEGRVGAAGYTPEFSRLWLCGARGSGQ